MLIPKSGSSENNEQTTSVDILGVRLKSKLAHKNRELRMPF